MTAANDFDRVLEAWFRADAPAAGAVGSRRCHRRRDGEDEATAGMADSGSMAAAAEPVHDRAALRRRGGARVADRDHGDPRVGSRPRVPSPFGPARPGIFVLNLYGDIVSMAPDGTRQHALTSGVAWDSNPVFSRDGTRVAFWSTGMLQALSDLVVMNADGSGRHAVARAELAARLALALTTMARWRGPRTGNRSPTGLTRRASHRCSLRAPTVPA